MAAAPLQLAPLCFSLPLTNASPSPPFSTPRALRTRPGPLQPGGTQLHHQTGCAKRMEIPGRDQAGRTSLGGP